MSDLPFASVYTSLDEIGQAFIQATEVENAAAWVQGDILVQAVADGFTLKAVARHCAGLTRRKTRTVQNRYRVSSVFPPHKRLEAVDWSLHLLAAQTENPDAWLAKAHDENLSYRDMKAAIKASGGDVEKHAPVYLLDNAEAVFCGETADNGIRFALVGVGVPRELGAGMRVLLTVVQPAVDEDAQTLSYEPVRKAAA